KLARITRRIDRATSKAETPIGGKPTVTARNFEVLARGSDSSSGGEHKVSGRRRARRRLRRQGAMLIMMRTFESRTGLISAAVPISNSVGCMREQTICECRVALGPPITTAGVKFNAWGINRFAMKRPFAVVIIYMVRRTKRRPRECWGGGTRAH